MHFMSQLILLLSSDPGRVKVSAPIVKWAGADNRVSQPSTFLVAEDEMQSFFLRHGSYQYS